MKTGLTRLLLGWLPLAGVVVSVIVSLVAAVEGVETALYAKPSILIWVLIFDAACGAEMAYTLKLRPPEFSGGLLGPDPGAQWAYRRFFKKPTWVLFGVLGLLIVARLSGLPASSLPAWSDEAYLIALIVWISLILFGYGLWGQEAVVRRGSLLYALMRVSREKRTPETAPPPTGSDG